MRRPSPSSGKPPWPSCSRKSSAAVPGLKRSVPAAPFPEGEKRGWRRRYSHLCDGTLVCHSVLQTKRTHNCSRTSEHMVESLESERIFPIISLSLLPRNEALNGPTYFGVARKVPRKVSPPPPFVPRSTGFPLCCAPEWRPEVWWPLD